MLPLLTLVLAVSIAPDAVRAAGPLPTATLPPASDAADSRALRWMRAMQRGRIDRRELAPAMAEAVPQPIVDLVAAEYGPMGAPTGFSLVRRERVPGGIASVYRVTFLAKDATWIFAVDPAGRIIGLHFYPPEAVPTPPPAPPNGTPGR